VPHAQKLKALTLDHFKGYEGLSGTLYYLKLNKLTHSESSLLLLNLAILRSNLSMESHHHLASRFDFDLNLNKDYFDSFSFRLCADYHLLLRHNNLSCSRSFFI